EIFRSALRRAGWQVLRYTPSTSFEAQLAKLFSVHGIDLLLDVGANAGQYASTMRRAGYGGDILSFEPLAEPWSRCSERTRSDPSWTIAPRMAVGDRDGAVEMHVAANSVSSSILDMKD